LAEHCVAAVFIEKASPQHSQGAPPEGSPPWSYVEGLQMWEVEARAKARETGYDTFWKLLRDKTYNK
jgi:hypothetical protein